MTRSLLLVLGLLLPACGGGNSAATQPATQTGLEDRDALAKLEVEVAKPLPEIWKDSTVAFIADPVTMCNGSDIEEHVKSEDAVQVEKAKAALQDAGITVQESTDQATVVFSIRILANCSGRWAATRDGRCVGNAWKRGSGREIGFIRGDSIRCRKSDAGVVA